MRIVSIIAVFLVSLNAAFAEPAADADKAAIKATVFDYFHGQGEADKERLYRAFAADHSSMVAIRTNAKGEDGIRSWKNMNQVLSRWASNKKPAGGDRDGEILDMHVIDGRIATVLFRFTDQYYDALTLAKINGEWKIVAKAFVAQ